MSLLAYGDSDLAAFRAENLRARLKRRFPQVGFKVTEVCDDTRVTLFHRSHPHVVNSADIAVISRAVLEQYYASGRTVSAGKAPALLYRSKPDGGKRLSLEMTASRLKARYPHLNVEHKTGDYGHGLWITYDAKGAQGEEVRRSIYRGPHNTSAVTADSFVDDIEVWRRW